MPAMAVVATKEFMTASGEDSPLIDFGREICGDLAVAERREWLITNGLGGFASGTAAGLLTRRYHGLLVAALQPPLGRTLLVSNLDETASYDDHAYRLATHRWAGGVVDPEGYRSMERFRLEGTAPVWTFACADALLEKQIWMQQEANTTYIRYSLERASRPLKLAIKVLVNYRDYHSVTHAGDWRMSIAPTEHGIQVGAFSGATPYYLLSAEAAIERAHEWYRNFDLGQERYRGLDSQEDHLHAGTFSAQLEPGGSLTLVATTDGTADLNGASAWNAHLAREKRILEQWSQAQPGTSAKAPAWIRRLALATDQFVVKRPLRDDPDARSTIAGYPWFGDWGRDTMIALPGLTLITGRPDEARSILRSFSRFVDRGMLPNRFPEAGESAEYNTVDATLWYFEAIRQYLGASRDEEQGQALLRELFPVLEEIIAWHRRGTRYNICVDPRDGLLAAGEPGVQLTWMDAKVGNWVVTPRIGKPIEVNALWYNALCTMVQFARALGKPVAELESMAERARTGFKKFWNRDLGFCFDVIEGPEGNDPALRPNQLFAVSLPESPLAPDQQRLVVEVCAREFVTSFGLRSLSPAHPSYQGHYGGDQRQRDAAYHQGTAWAWLLGPFVLAHLRVYGDVGHAASFLEPMAQHLRAHGLGSISEIFDGDAPFAPRGCIAQAWSVAEVLRAWTVIRKARTDREG